MQITDVSSKIATGAAGGDRLKVAGMRFHFIGAGGIGMSGLAKVLLKNGGIVTGSDQTATAVTEALCGMGAEIRIGHRQANVHPKTHAVVVSAAIKPDNPELRLARANGCRIYKYAELLGELMNYYRGIAVSGTHGKSTTTAWLAWCLEQAGRSPGFIVGADVPQMGGSSGVGEGEFFVAEACEYDRSFLNLRAEIAAILNIEPDHLDYYRDIDEIVEAFEQFASAIKPGGVLVANAEDANAAGIMSRLADEVRCESFGFGQGCVFRAANLAEVDGLYSFDVYHNGRLLGRTSIGLPGRHNVLNGLAVVAMGINAGLDGGELLELLGGFEGADRRLMFKGRGNDVTILDDYAHHPTEIRASLDAIRRRYRPRRIWCVFQPHQYSRTRFLLDDFAESFSLADVTIVPEIYFVRDSQQSRRQVNSEVLVERIRARGGEAVFIEGFEGICDYLLENVGPGELVVTMGAGDVWKVADEYIRRLREDS